MLWVLQSKSDTFLSKSEITKFQASRNIDALINIELNWAEHEHYCLL